MVWLSWQSGCVLNKQTFGQNICLMSTVLKDKKIKKRLGITHFLKKHQIYVWSNKNQFNRSALQLGLLPLMKSLAKTIENSVIYDLTRFESGFDFSEISLSLSLEILMSFHGSFSIFSIKTFNLFLQLYCLQRQQEGHQNDQENRSNTF